MGLRMRLPWTDAARQFVVDETPEPLYALDQEAGAPGALGGADLLELVSRAMLENERLVALAGRLEQSQSRGADEEVLRVVRSLLPALDSFDRILEMARGFDMTDVLANWLRSVEGIQERVLSALERQGLEVVDPLGQGVDLNRDEVVEYRRTQAQPGDTVLEVRRRGYRFRGKMIRDAQVVVAHNERSV